MYLLSIFSFIHLDSILYPFFCVPYLNMAPISIVSKRLTKTDINHRLAFPTDKLHLLPAFEDGANRIELRVRVRLGGELHRHVLRCGVRRTGYKKPVVERGWTRIVKEKELRQGDLLHIDLDDDGELVFVFQRSIRLFGRWVEAEI